MTQFLLDGMNPFAMESQPLAMNNYGIAYHLVVLPAAAVWGNTLAVHRAVSAVFILLSFLLITRTALSVTQDPGVSVACGLLASMALLAQAGVGAFPSAMGTFMYLAALLVPLRRGFDRGGLVASACLSVIAFYTKPYFLLSFAIVASYIFFFQSKRKALAYAAIFAILFTASFVLVRVALPLYFIDTIVSNISNTSRDWGHLGWQVQVLSTEFLPCLIGAIGVLVLDGLRVGRGASDVRGRSESPGAGWMGNAPIGLRPGFPSYAFLSSVLAFGLVLGPHLGGFLTYGYQLVVPLFLLWLLHKRSWKTRLGLILAPLLLANLFLFGQANLNARLLRQSASSTQAWARLYRWVDGSHHVLNSPVLVSRMISQGMQPVDSGQTEYYFDIAPYPDLPWLGPAYVTVQENGERYLDSMRSSVIHQEFDSVIIGRQGSLVDYDTLRQHYRQTATVLVDMPQTQLEWTIEIWAPIEDSAQPEAAQ